MLARCFLFLILVVQGSCTSRGRPFETAGSEADASSSSRTTVEARDRPPTPEASSKDDRASGGGPDDGVQRSDASRRGSQAAESDGARAPATRTEGRGRIPAHAIRADGLMVDDELIRVEDILEPLQSRFPALAAEHSQESYWKRVSELVRAQIIEVVAQHLIWNKARSQMTDELKPQLEKAVAKMEKERINREFGGRETLYEKYLAQHGKTREEVRERLRRSVLIDSYLRDRLLPLIPPPRKSELLEYYRSHTASFSRPERREMHLIDVPVAAFLDLSRPITRQDEVKAEAEARSLIERAAKALSEGRSFEEVARECNQGLHRETGGNWGFITAPSPGQTTALQGRWEAPSRRLFELSEGAHSEVIESARSFFIVKVGQIEAGKQLTFQEAQPEITMQLRQQRFNKLRSDFLQKQLEHSTLGSLEEFVTAVMTRVPGPGEARRTQVAEYEAIPARSPPLKTDQRSRP